MASQVLRDGDQFFVRWEEGWQGTEWRSRVESLRTLSKAKAKLWLAQGACHGVTRHAETCKKCAYPNPPASSQ